MERLKTPTQFLYSPGQIAFAAFLGSPIAGCWFLFCNFSDLGKRREAWLSVALAGISMAALLVVSFFLPGFPRIIIPVAYSTGLGIAAVRIQGGDIARHIAEGGRIDSWWSVVGLSLLFSTALVVVVVSAAVAFLKFSLR